MKKSKIKPLIYILDAVLIAVIFATATSYNTKNNKGFFSQSEASEQPQEIEDSIDYKQEMRDWVIEISDVSKNINPNFLIIPQNCTELLTADGNHDSKIQHDFIKAIDGIGQEGLSYGYSRFNSQTSDGTNETLTDMLKIAKDNDVKVIALDYCIQEQKITQAREYNGSNGFIGFQSQHLELADIPTTLPHNNNDSDINKLEDARNCLFLLNPQAFASSKDLISALGQTNYDIIILDSYFEDNKMLTKKQVSTLKAKPDGSKRLVISYLSIGEAEDYRYYFDSSYYNSPPIWMLNENSNWQGNYIVEYWNPEWQEIIASGKDSYLKKIIDAGFDGAYLDIVDGYQNFE